MKEYILVMVGIVFLSIVALAWMTSPGESEISRWTIADEYWAAICVYHEARGESSDAQIGVAHVIFNRAEHTGTEVSEVIFKPNQFSWANGGERPPIDEYHSFLSVMINVHECLIRRAENDRFGGRAFFRDTTMSPPEEAIDIYREDRLIFYNLPGEYGSS